MNSLEGEPMLDVLEINARKRIEMVWTGSKDNVGNMMLRLYST